MEKIYILILLTLLQDVFTHPQVGPSIEVIRTNRKAVGDVNYVYGGKQAVPSEFPHLAAIGYSKNFKKFWGCGGTLNNKRFVLTAAHCLEDKDRRILGKAVYVRLGDIDLKDSSDDANVQQINVLKRIAHPDYNHPMKYNDIGLLKLKEDAIFNRFVKPACLHKTYDIMQTQAEVVGWGLTEHGYAARSKKLYKVVIDLHHIDRCTEIVNRMDVNTINKFLSENLQDDSMICAGVLAGGKDSCKGDSGGPLQVNSTSTECSAEIIGIVSFGLGGCALVNTPAVYVRVSHYVPWIESVINSSH